MKRFIIATLVLGIALLGLQAQASANLLTNPGFDDPSTAPWYSWTQGPGSVDLASTVYSLSPPKSSEHELGYLYGSLAGDYAVSCQLLPGSAWSVGTTLYGHGYLKGDIDGNSEGYAKLVYWRGPAGIGSILGESTSAKYSMISLSDGWLELPSWSGIVPVNTDNVEFVFINFAKRDGAQSTVYFDDAYADTTQIPEPATMLLFGSGLVGLLGFSRRKRS